MIGKNQPLKAYLEQAGIKIIELTDKLKIGKQAAYHLANKKAGQFTLIEMAGLSAIFKVDPDLVFGEDYAEPLKNMSIKNIEESLFLHVKAPKSQENKNEFFKQYFKNLSLYISKIESSVKVLYYPSEYRNILVEGNRKNYFIRKYEAYYKELDQKIKVVSSNKNFKYQRVLQMPHNFGVKLNKQSYEEGLTNPKGRILPRMIELQKEECINYYMLFLINDFMFRHIWNMFDVLQERFSLRIRKYPLRLFTFFMVNDDRLVTEYDRHSGLENLASPDMAFFEKRSQVSKGYYSNTLIDNHKFDFSRMMRDESICFEVTKIDILKSLQKMRDDFKEEEKVLGKLRSVPSIDSFLSESTLKEKKKSILSKIKFVEKNLK